jgi:hypothetical protein
MQLLVMLDAWLPWTMARGSLDTMSGAAYTTYRYGAGGPLCMTAAVRFDGDPSPFVEAMLWWAGASGSRATPIVEGTVVRFEACSRGAAATSPPLPLISPSREVLIENSAVPVGAAVGGVTDAKPFLCMARTMIDDPNTAPLLVKQGLSDAELAVLDAARNDALRTCTQ